MKNSKEIELYLLKCASLKMALDNMSPTSKRKPLISEQSSSKSSISQFSHEVRTNAEAMAEYYKLFYMIENDLRKLIDDTIIEAHGSEWWDTHCPISAKEEYKLNQQREQEAGYSSRSDNKLDYISFGQLGEIMRTNWDLFGGILSNQKAMGRVMFALNNLRGPIAHCGVLAEDEVDRLKLTLKDYFRLLEGPK